MTELREPLVGPEVDLRNYPFTPMFRARLFGSSFHARVSDSGWRAGVTLWLKSWDQVPAGSLPDDEIDLCRLAELGREHKRWRKLKAEALWGWFKCADGRLYHATVAELVNEAWETKLAQRDRTEKARVTKEAKRLSQSLSQHTQLPVTDRSTEPVTEAVTASNRREGNRTEGNGSKNQNQKTTIEASVGGDFASPQAASAAHVNGSATGPPALAQSEETLEEPGFERKKFDAMVVTLPGQTR